MQNLMQSVPGQGSNTSFWLDTWLTDMPLWRKFPSLFSLERAKDVTVHERIKMVNGMVVLKFQWRKEPSSLDELYEMEELYEDLSTFTPNNEEDQWIWKLGSSGSFSVSSIRGLLQQKKFHDLGIDFEWNNWNPIKVNFFVWRLALNRIPTMVALLRRNIRTPSTRCVFCGDFEETAEHLFVDCHLSQEVWDFVSDWCRIPSIYAFEVIDLLRLHRSLRGSSKWKKAIYSIVQITLWSIWRCRNNVVFKGKQTRINEIKEEVKVLGFLWIKNRAKAHALTWVEWCNFNLYSMEG